MSDTTLEDDLQYARSLPEARAYRRMASAMGYRPEAPADQLTGTITEPLEDLDLEVEAIHYAGRVQAEMDEDAPLRFSGVPDFDGREAHVYAVEAARLLCSMDYARARKALTMALDSIDGLEDSRW